MPAAAKSGRVSSKMRPLDRAMVSVFSVIVVVCRQTLNLYQVGGLTFSIV